MSEQSAAFSAAFRLVLHSNFWISFSNNCSIKLGIHLRFGKLKHITITHTQVPALNILSNDIDWLQQFQGHT